MSIGLKHTEKFAPGESLPLARVLDELPWNSDGPLPAVSQQVDSAPIIDPAELYGS